LDPSALCVLPKILCSQIGLAINSPKAAEDNPFILHQYRDAKYVTSFYEDGQDGMQPYYYLWAAPGENRSMGMRPALYFPYDFLETRYRTMKINKDWVGLGQNGRMCYHNQSGEKVWNECC
jgi:hypothetical protein